MVQIAKWSQRPKSLNDPHKGLKRKEAKINCGFFQWEVGQPRELYIGRGQDKRKGNMFIMISYTPHTLHLGVALGSLFLGGLV